MIRYIPYNKKRQSQFGYVLIEVLISLVISAAIMTGLFSSFFQMHTALQTTEYFSDVYERATVAYRQLSRDIHGAFGPVAAEKTQKNERADNTQQNATQNTKTMNQKSTNQTALANVFYGVNAEKMFNRLSCITANTLQVYWNDQVGKAKPRIARVVYRLVMQKADPPTYRLTRQEAYASLRMEAFNVTAEKPIRQLTVIDGIKSCSVSYAVAVENKEASQDSGKEKKKRYTYKTFSSWTEEQEKICSEQGVKKAYPDLVTMHLVLWDARQRMATEFTFVFPVGGVMPIEFEPAGIEETINTAQSQQQKTGDKKSEKKVQIPNVNKQKAIP